MLTALPVSSSSDFTVLFNVHFMNKGLLFIFVIRFMPSRLKNGCNLFLQFHNYQVSAHALACLSGSACRCSAVDYLDRDGCGLRFYFLSDLSCHSL